ncbi:hypothetical protein [Oryzobacter terrae]|uniref:hypothetical protein n=1 Tax=Oryzobacter terrae TaxID=1620385 RepID=UPI00366C2CBA
MTAVAALLAVLAVLAWPGDGGGHGRSTGRAGRTGRTDAPHGSSGAGGSVGDPVPGGARTWWRRSRAASGGHRGVPGDDGRWVADLAEVVAVGLEAGLDLAAAALAAARSPGVVRCAPWLVDRLEQAHPTGAPISACLDPPPGTGPAVRRDLDVLVAAWRLAEEAGAPAAEVTAAAAGAVRERRAARQRAAVAVAGPRASMWLLTTLPLVGPVGGALVGFGPERLYGSGPARTVAVGGLVLTAGGWCWARSVLSRATRPGTTGAPEVDGVRPSGDGAGRTRE